MFQYRGAQSLSHSPPPGLELCRTGPQKWWVSACACVHAHRLHRTIPSPLPLLVHKAKKIGEFCSRLKNQHFQIGNISYNICDRTTVLSEQFSVSSSKIQGIVFNVLDLSGFIHLFLNIETTKKRFITKKTYR